METEQKSEIEGPTPTWVYETGHMYEKEPAKAARMEKSTLGIDQSDKRGTPQTPLQQTQTATKQEPQESITPILYWVRHKISPLNKDTNPAESAWERLSSLMSGPTSIVSSDDSKVEEVVHTESFVGAKKMETEHKSEIHQRTPTLWWNRNEIVPRQDGNMQRAKGAWEQLSSLVSGPTTVHDGNQEETETEETVHQVTSWRKISSLISGPATVLNNDDDDYDNDDVEEGRDVLSSVTDCFDSLPVREY